MTADDMTLPISQEEADLLLGKLYELVRRRPSAGKDPLLLGTTRLLLACRSAGTTEVPPPTAVPPPAPVAVPTAPVAEPAAEPREESTVDDDTVARLQAEIVREREVLGAAYAQAVMERDQALTRNQELTAGMEEREARYREAEEKIKASLAAMEASYMQGVNALQKQVSEEGFAKATAQGESERLRGEVLRLKEVIAKARTEILAPVEFSAKSPKYTFRGTGKPIPCCPVCLGLSPENVSSHPDAGHKKSCWLGKLAMQLKA